MRHAASSRPESLKRRPAVNPRIDHQLVLARCYLELGDEHQARQVMQAALEHHRYSPAYVRRNHSRAAAQMKKLLKQIS